MRAAAGAAIVVAPEAGPAAAEPGADEAGPEAAAPEAGSTAAASEAGLAAAAAAVSAAWPVAAAAFCTREEATRRAMTATAKKRSLRPASIVVDDDEGIVGREEERLVMCSRSEKKREVGVHSCGGVGGRFIWWTEVGDVSSIVWLGRKPEN